MPKRAADSDLVSEPHGVNPTVSSRELAEFAALNRRRLFGGPSLSLEELERWLALRQRLDRRFASGASPILCAIERRTYFRVPTHLKVRFASGDELRSAWLHDLSPGGLFLATDAALEPGSRLVLRIEPDSEREPIELRGTVAWARPEAEGDRPAGMGVRFDELAIQDRHAVLRLLRDETATQEP